MQFPGVPLQIQERKVLLFALDVTMLLSAAAVSIVIWAARIGTSFGSQLVPSKMKWFGVMAFIWLILAAANSLYSPRIAGNLRLVINRLLRVAVLLLSTYLVVYFVSSPGSAPRHTALSFAFAATLLTGLGRMAYGLFLGGPPFRRRVILVGSGDRGVALARAMGQEHPGGYYLVGFVDDDPDRLGQNVEGLPVLGTVQDLPEVVSKAKVSEIILCATDSPQEKSVRPLLDCYERGIAILPMERLFEEMTGRVPLELMGQNWERILPLSHPAQSFLYRVAKRGIDLLVALGGLTVFGLLFPLAAVAIYLDSGRPIFYRQNRVGLGGRVFRLLKLRTMVQNAEVSGVAVWAAERDLRVTRVGRVLRALMLDEFPQFYNVLRGDMSFVGPRPERPEIVADLEKTIPFYRTRHSVRPGMAGWALVQTGYGRTLGDAARKLEYDLYYIKHQSLYLDAIIVLKTIGKALSLRLDEKGKSSVPPEMGCPSPARDSGEDRIPR